MLLSSGFALPLAGAAVTGTMTTAIRRVHAEKGPWTTDGGWEYNAVLIGATLALVEEKCGPGWAAAAGVAGVAGSFAITELAAREQQPDEVFQPIPFQGAEQVRETAQV